MNNDIKVKRLTKITGLLLIFSILISTLSVYSVFAASVGKLEVEQTNAEYEQIYGWETQAEMDVIDTSFNFGLNKINFDKKYVKEGNGSMHVKVEETINKPTSSMGSNIHDGLGDKPFIQLYTAIMETKDFRKYDGISLWVLNLSDKPISLDLRLTTAENKFVLGKQIALNGCWNRLDFYFNPIKDAYRGLDIVSNLQILFDIRDKYEGEYEFYLDTISFIKGDGIQKPETPNYVGNNMICDYENSWFAESASAIFDAHWYTQNSIYNPQFMQNNNKAFVKEGNGSLRIKRLSTGYRYVTTMEMRAYCSLFASDYLSKVPFANYNVNETSIYLDVYNDCAYELDFTLSLNDEVTTYEKMFVLAPKTWTTIEVKMSDVTDFNWSNVKKFNVLLREYFGANYTDMYVDNIRFGAQSLEG